MTGSSEIPRHQGTVALRGTRIRQAHDWEHKIHPDDAENVAGLVDGTTVSFYLTGPDGSKKAAGVREVHTKATPSAKVLHARR